MASSSAGGAGGGDAGPACATDADCGTPADCWLYKCQSGACNLYPTQAKKIGYPWGDCQATQCDGFGGAQTIWDPGDTPPNIECNYGTCAGDFPGPYAVAYIPMDDGTPCNGGACQSGVCTP